MRGRPASERTSFVGREADLAEIDRLVAESVPLVTIAGFAGVGKTRLARRYAELHAHHFPGGCWFVDLTPARTLEGVCVAVSRALDVPLAGGAATELVEQLGRAMDARGAALFVFDNFEQVAAAAAATLAQWTEAASEACFLVTSRERLRVSVENCVPLEPLGLPGEGETDAARIAACPAVELFVDRARAVRSDWQVSADEATALAAIVRALDGLPLAVELCAARVGVLRVAQLRELLLRRFDVLVSDGREAHPRQSTLRAAIDWSWELLEPDEREALAQASVFRGGFSLETWTDVIADGAPAARTSIDLLQALHDKSLVRALDTDLAPGERRYDLYQSIREYAAEKLTASGAAEAAQERHARHYLDAGARWAEQSERRGGAVARRRLMLERDNLLAVHARALAGNRAQHADVAARALLALEPVYATRGPLTQYRGLLEQTLLEPGGGSLSAAVRARVCSSLGLARILSGHFVEAVPILEEALSLAEAAGDAVTRAVVLGNLSYGRARQGRWQDAEQRVAQALEGLAEVHEPRARALVHNARGKLLTDVGRLEDAERAFSEALAIAEAAGCERDEGAIVANLAGRAFEQGKVERARELYERGARVAERVSDRRLLAAMVGQLGVVEQEQGRFDLSNRELDRALALVGDLGAHGLENVLRVFRANLWLEQRRDLDALGEHQRAAAALERSGNRRYLALARAGVAVAHARVGRLPEAAAGFAAARAGLERYGRPTDLETLEVLRDELTLAEAREAQAAGDSARANAAREGVRARLGARAAPLHATPLASDELRLALRLVSRSLEASPDGPAPRAEDASAPPPWRVRDDGRAFSAPGGGVVRLERRGAPARMLHALAGLRCSAPGTALSTSDLIEAGWPGQRMHPESGANRVRVAVNLLRKLGLRGLLISGEGGYLLDPSVALELVEQIDRDTVSSSP